MAPPFRGLRTTDVIRALEKAGGVVRTGRGDHINVKMPNGQIVTLTRVREVKIGLLRQAIRRAGLTQEEFARLMGE